MKIIKTAVAGAVLAATAAGGLLLGASPAFAATPAWEPDANGNGGTISFYNSAGTQVTGGSNLSHLFDYAVASSAEDPNGFKKANIQFAYPDHNKSTDGWFVNGQSSSTSYPVTSGPSSITGLPASTPVATINSSEANLAAALGGATLDTTAGYANIVQIRLVQSSGTAYWTADIMYDKTAGTWTQVYPAVVTNTTTTLTANPNPSTVGDHVTLTATVAPSSAAGTIQFKDGSTSLGAPVPVSSGTATTTVSTFAAGPHALSAVFTPTDPTSFGGSTGTFSETVNPPATATTTSLSVTGGYQTAGAAATLTAIVGPSGATGSVAFYDNGSSTPIPGTVTSGSGNTFTLNLASGFTAGGHSIVAKFTPTDITQYEVSQSAPQSFLTQAPLQGACADPASVCSEDQNIKATVPVGTLVLNTPYTPSSPLDLGTLALSNNSTVLIGSAQFQHIIVTDTRSGNLPWTLKALATNLTDGGSNPGSVINAQNLGLTAMAPTTSSPGYTGVVTFTPNPAANGVAPNDPGSLGLGGTTQHTVASVDHGLGSLEMAGTLTLIAPSSTEPNVFTGTITFTVG